MFLYEDLLKLNNIDDTLVEGFTKQQQKFADKNMANTTVGSTLYTLKGSKISRCGIGVGKLIGGEIYAHKDYYSTIIPPDLGNKFLNILKEVAPDFKYNCFKYNTVTQRVAFQEAPDFDTAREPVVGDWIAIDLNGNVSKGHSNYIWHHKWLWVKNDYKGFDVAESWEWSKTWLSVLPVPADGNGIERWENQLAQYGLK